MKLQINNKKLYMEITPVEWIKIGQSANVIKWLENTGELEPYVFSNYIKKIDDKQYGLFEANIPLEVVKKIVGQKSDEITIKNYFANKLELFNSVQDNINVEFKNKNEVAIKVWAQWDYN